MTEEIRKQIGLLRHRIISPVLMETGRTQMEYFRKIGQEEFAIPGSSGKKYFAPATMKGWLRQYRSFGFNGLLPKTRVDSGQARFIKAEVESKIRDLRTEHLEISVAKFYRLCQKEKIFTKNQICLQTLRRYLKANGPFPIVDTAQGRKRYEMSRFGELWVGDFMHGPVLEQKKRKAILLAVIDDYSRMIVGYRWSFEETTMPIEYVLKDALLCYGKPDRIYLDNGASFSSDYLRLVCANLDIGLIHSKPYDSPSRGKIERFWRTVRESFLCDFKGKTLKELSDAFDIWLRQEYHLVHHNGISCRPIDRYQLSLSEYPRSRVNEEILEELFLVRIYRKVNKDATISFKNLIYELPPQYIGKKVEIKYRQENNRELFLYENNKRVTVIKVVDVRANGRAYKPRGRNTVIPYQGGAK
jgi:transposase InsO family protein